MRAAGLAPLVALAVAGCVTASAPVHGRVVATRSDGGTGETPDTVFVVELINDGARRCTIAGYAIVWGTGVLAGRVRCRAGATVDAGRGMRTTCVVQSRSPSGPTPGLGRVRVVDVDSTCARRR